MLCFALLAAINHSGVVMVKTMDTSNLYATIQQKPRIPRPWEAKLGTFTLAWLQASHAWLDLSSGTTSLERRP